MNNQNKSRSKSDMMSQQNNVFSRREVNHAEKRAHIIGLAVLLKRDRFDDDVNDDVFFVVGRKR